MNNVNEEHIIRDGKNLTRFETWISNLNSIFFIWEEAKNVTRDQSKLNSPLNYLKIQETRTKFNPIEQNPKTTKTRDYEIDREN